MQFTNGVPISCLLFHWYQFTNRQIVYARPSGVNISSLQIEPLVPVVRVSVCVYWTLDLPQVDCEMRPQVDCEMRDKESKGRSPESSDT